MDRSIYKNPEEYIIRPRVRDAAVNFLGFLNRRNFWTSELIVEGMDYIETTDEPAIIAPNHRSNADPLLDGTLLYQFGDREVAAPAKPELWNSKLLGKTVESLGAFPVYRGSASPEEREASMAHFLSTAQYALESGKHVLIYPEGKRTISDEIRLRKRGAALLSLATGAPIIPVGHYGTEHMFNPLNRRPVVTVFCAPYKTADLLPSATESAEGTTFAKDLLEAKLQDAFDKSKKTYREVSNR